MPRPVLFIVGTILAASASADGPAPFAGVESRWEGFFAHTTSRSMGRRRPWSSQSSHYPGSPGPGGVSSSVNCRMQTSNCTGGAGT